MIKNLFKNVLLASHPVGSIYITTDGSFDPHESWGGSWELLEDRFLVGAGNTYTLGASGGEAEHTLTINEVPNRLLARTTASAAGYADWISSSSSSGYTSHCLFDEVNGGSTNYQQPHNNLPPYTAVNMWLRTA